jgi:hypothetical protein
MSAPNETQDQRSREQKVTFAGSQTQAEGQAVRCDSRDNHLGDLQARHFGLTFYLEST